MSSAICFNLDQSKILSFGNGLTTHESQILTILKKKKESFENIVGKGEMLVTSIFPFPVIFFFYLSDTNCINN